ncbi:GNAT family N-acetyltransferase [Lentiprolixibacter aurantiacus]|uniref:GNAT family N-acetyltransferase n=1 Tax=Lentiprolixibacter aurantiacus TaxID=2993939 RepID=A0AAE3MM97_9FLAO|nr:GNAT family N-acetyltransferase [Lentiprolixibacter aurantiacus]MCX2720013.1 GNAT family N-acetyltransferase [Lentiprolixibacter aurantiacus]
MAKQIQLLFRASYAIEAQLLGADDFPPLKRELESYMQSKNTFYGYYSEGNLAAAMEIDARPKSTHIQSLVVHPDYFRRGIGRALVNFVFENYTSEVFTVETGAANGPATELYLKCGFEERYKYNTDHGIRKVRFQKQIKV